MPSFAGLTPSSTLVFEKLEFLPTTSAWPGFNVVDNYAVLATSVLIVEKAGSYKFFLASDDGSLLFIDGSLVVDNGGLHSFSEKSASIYLTPGYYAIEVKAKHVSLPLIIVIFFPLSSPLSLSLSLSLLLEALGT